MFCSTLKAAILVAAIITTITAAPVNPATEYFGLPLEWSPFGFLTSAVSIGTPPQPVKSFVDWTWIGQYAFTPLCNGSMTDTSKCFAKGQILFNQTKSTSFRNESDLYRPQTWNPNHFFFYKDLSVQYGSDIERVGSKISSRITIMAADTHFNLMEPYPFTGVFGMSPAFKGHDPSTQSAFAQLYKTGAFQSPQVGFIYCYNSTFGNTAPKRSVCNGNDALQMLGGFNHSYINGDITWYDNVVDPEVNVVDFVYSPAVLQYWAAKLAKHMIGDEEQTLNQSAGSTAIFDHASYGRGAPMSTKSYARLRQITDAKPITLTKEQAPNNGNQTFASVDCKSVSTFPPLKYQLAGSDAVWEIIPQNYVERVPSKSGEVCVLNVRTLGDGDFILGNFGETFAKDKVILFDYKALRVGVAHVKVV